MVESKAGLSLARLSGQLHRGHFAYLRCVANGLDAQALAARELGLEHGAELRNLHRSVVEQARAIARRRGDSRWRLIGLDIVSPAESAVTNAPQMDEWAEAEGFDGWSQAEILELYQERFGSPDPSVVRRLARNGRLIKKRISLLWELEQAAGEPARPTDLLDGWLPPEIAEQLRRCGDLTLADLQARIARGGRWWRVLSAHGPVKGRRLAAHVASLIPPAAPAPASWALTTVERGSERLSGRLGANRAQAGFAGTRAQDDREAVEAWITARATSPATKKQYRREAERFILFCVIERNKALADANAEDCSAYVVFLANVPAAWSSRQNAGRLEKGWAPFKGELSVASQQLALTVVHSLFEWLVKARYLGSSPWVLVNRRLGDDERFTRDDDSRAFTPKAWEALQAEVERMPAGASRERLRWICEFVRATGLRASELIGLRREQLIKRQGGWWLKVHGKGSKNRLVTVPSAAMRATENYFQNRGLLLGMAPAETPMLASVVDGAAPISYSALAQTFKRFVTKAAKHLNADEQRQAERASAHWLRHTHATRAAERGVPPDVLQANLGQADPRTTARYYRAQLDRREQAMEDAFGAP